MLHIFKDEEIELLALLLLGYGLVYQLLFIDLDLTALFGRKITSYVLNTFANGENYVSLLIVSKPPE